MPPGDIVLYVVEVNGVPVHVSEVPVDGAVIADTAESYLRCMGGKCELPRVPGEPSGTFEVNVCDYFGCSDSVKFVSEMLPELLIEDGKVVLPVEEATVWECENGCTEKKVLINCASLPKYFVARCSDGSIRYRDLPSPQENQEIWSCSQVGKCSVCKPKVMTKCSLDMGSDVPTCPLGCICPDDLVFPISVTFDETYTVRFSGEASGRVKVVGYILNLVEENGVYKATLERVAECETEIEVSGESAQFSLPCQADHVKVIPLEGSIGALPSKCSSPLDPSPECIKCASCLGVQLSEECFRALPVGKGEAVSVTVDAVNAKVSSEERICVDMLDEDGEVSLTECGNEVTVKSNQVRIYSPDGRPVSVSIINGVVYRIGNCEEWGNTDPLGNWDSALAKIKKVASDSLANKDVRPVLIGVGNVGGCTFTSVYLVYPLPIYLFEDKVGNFLGESVTFNATVSVDGFTVSISADDVPVPPWGSEVTVSLSAGGVKLENIASTIHTTGKFEGYIYTGFGTVQASFTFDPYLIQTSSPPSARAQLTLRGGCLAVSSQDEILATVGWPDGVEVISGNEVSVCWSARVCARREALIHGLFTGKDIATVKIPVDLSFVPQGASSPVAEGTFGDFTARKEGICYSVERINAPKIEVVTVTAPEAVPVLTDKVKLGSEAVLTVWMEGSTLTASGEELVFKAFGCSSSPCTVTAFLEDQYGNILAGSMQVETDLFPPRIYSAYLGTRLVDMKLVKSGSVKGIVDRERCVPLFTDLGPFAVYPELVLPEACVCSDPDTPAAVRVNDYCEPLQEGVLVGEGKMIPCYSSAFIVDQTNILDTLRKVEENKDSLTLSALEELLPGFTVEEILEVYLSDDPARKALEIMCEKGTVKCTEIKCCQEVPFTTSLVCFPGVECKLLPLDACSGDETGGEVLGAVTVLALFLALLLTYRDQHG